MSHIFHKRSALYGRSFVIRASFILLVAGTMNLRCNSSLSRSEKGMDSLQDRIARMETVVDRAEAIRAVKRLQYAYGHYAEFGLWDDLADLFAEKGVGYYPPGKLGKDEIREYFLKGVGGGNTGLPDGVLHSPMMLQPVINLEPDGKTARGRWRLFSMLGTYEKKAEWKGGVFENEYVLEDGVWKIAKLNFYPQYSGPYEQAGWNIDKGDIPIHYTPDLVGNPVPEDKSPATAPGSTPGEEALHTRLSDLLGRAQRLNDESDVNNLQNIYGYYVDRKMWDDVADLFSEDGTLEAGPAGAYVGRKSIRHALEQFGPQGLREGELNDHLQVQTIVHVSPDGITARARGSELVMAGKYGGAGEWRLGVFENEYVKRDGIWRIQSMHVYPRLRADYDKGWAKGAMPVGGISKEFPPDRPSADRYELFPEFHVPPFHYVHPVTGRLPGYPEGEVLSGGVSDRKTGLPAGTGMEKGAASIQKLNEMTEETERLLKRAVGYDACENLTSAYGYYIDDFLWDDFSDLFALDGLREAPFEGFYIGRERIRKSLKTQYPGAGGRATGFFTCHQLIQPVVHVSEDGRSADIRVRLFQLSGPDANNGFWMAGILEKKARIEDGIWKLTSMDLDYTWTADYKGGWVKGPMSFRLASGTMKEKFPPDRPLRGPTDAPFPKIADVPFHYVNPVSGRRPPLLLE
ncbi:MAG: nuclear transport factor 2 family protein [Acidobacteria bacterium]|nr:nuclear transport factor 2 family protein [Acidobacteriota bacterium]